MHTHGCERILKRIYVRRYRHCRRPGTCRAPSARSSTLLPRTRARARRHVHWQGSASTRTCAHMRETRHPHAHAHACMYVCMLYVRMYVRMHARMYVCKFTCMCTQAALAAAQAAAKKNQDAMANAAKMLKESQEMLGKDAISLPSLGDPKGGPSPLFKAVVDGVCVSACVFHRCRYNPHDGRAADTHACDVADTHACDARARAGARTHTLTHKKQI